MDNLSDVVKPPPTVAQFGLKKQDSYANAIYANAIAQKRSFRKQGSYETAVESGAALR